MGPSCKQPGRVYDTRTNEGLRATYEEGEAVSVAQEILRSAEELHGRLAGLREEFERRLNGIMNPITDNQPVLEETRRQFPPYWNDLASHIDNAHCAVSDLSELLKAVEF